MRSDRARVWITSRDPSDFVRSRPLAGYEALSSVEELPSEPYDLATSKVLLVTTVHALDEAPLILEAAVRRVDMVVALHLHRVEHRSFLDELERVADVHRLDEPRHLASSVGVEGRALLSLLAHGSDVERAGRILGMSRRTAYRRLDDLYVLLGAVSMNDAIVRAHHVGLLDGFPTSSEG